MTTQADVHIRMPQELLDRIDAHRGLLPRNPWIKAVMAKAIEEGWFKAPTAAGGED